MTKKIFLSAQIGSQSTTRGTRKQGQQTATFYNDANTQVGQQIGPASSFNNQPGGKYAKFN